MIGLDTNVVIRYLVQDDKKQSTAATRFIEKSLTTEIPRLYQPCLLVRDHMGASALLWYYQAADAIDYRGIAHDQCVK